MLRCFSLVGWLLIVAILCGGCVRGGWLLGRRVPSWRRIGVVRIVGISSTRSGCRFYRLVGCGIFAGCGGCTWLLRFVLSCVVGGCFDDDAPFCRHEEVIAYSAGPQPASLRFLDFDDGLPFWSVFFADVVGC